MPTDGRSQWTNHFWESVLQALRLMCPQRACTMMLMAILILPSWSQLKTLLFLHAVDNCSLAAVYGPLHGSPPHHLDLGSNGRHASCFTKLIVLLLIIATLPSGSSESKRHIQSLLCQWFP